MLRRVTHRMARWPYGALVRSSGVSDRGGDGSPSLPPSCRHHDGSPGGDRVGRRHRRLHELAWSLPVFGGIHHGGDQGHHDDCRAPAVERFGRNAHRVVGPPGRRGLPEQRAPLQRGVLAATGRHRLLRHRGRRPALRGLCPGPRCPTGGSLGWSQLWRILVLPGTGRRRVVAQRGGRRIGDAVRHHRRGRTAGRRL